MPDTQTKTAKGAMPSREASLHWVAGAITLALFLTSGAYMRWLRTPPVGQLDHATRAVYRSRHLFLLFSAVLNLAVAGVPRLRRTRKLVAGALLVTPLLFVVAFFVEPARGIQAASWSRPAFYVLFGAAIILLLAGRPRLRQ